MYKDSALDKQTRQNGGGIEHLYAISRKTSEQPRTLNHPKLFRPDSGEIEVKPGTVLFAFEQGMAPLTKFRSLLTARRNLLPRHTVAV